MSSYEMFSEVYDEFMKDTPYDEWVYYIEKIWETAGFKPKLIAELACGTGNITQRLFEKGYDIIGIDNSPDMLAKAKQKNGDILYVEQDMRELELYSAVDCVLCLCDGINYITDKRELLTVFKLVNKYLMPQGVFIFDINTIYKFKEILADNTFCETREDMAYTWENYYDEDEKINEYYTNFFILDKKMGLYKRFEEYHYEKGYEVDEIKRLLEEAGFKLEGIYDELSFESPKKDSQRIYFYAKKFNATQIWREAPKE